MKTLSRIFLCCLALSAARAEDFQGASHKLDYESEPIKYNDKTPADAISKLQHRLAAGETKLKFDEQFGYLPSLLDALKIPRSSQALVKPFDALPPVMRNHLLQRLHAILTGEDRDPQFAALGDKERRAILEILCETKPNLPAYWRQ